ncbi:unnamed protein product [Adineta ricciae]|uniref:Uncharacterized protein n=1 Tax=Adineta ricciae TaxID=249248 RepID=A0A815TM27_ADIRI|nr:unnamed protein product [Adineta ricciae]
MAEKEVKHQIALSTIIVIIILILILTGVTIAIPVLFRDSTNSTVSAPPEYVKNECTQSMSTIAVLSSIVNEEPFPYRYYNYIYRPGVILKTVSLIFGFRHDTKSWSLDKITFVDTTTGIDLMQDGDFESNYLNQSYSQCILSNTRNSISDILFDLPYSNDFYYNDQTNVGMTYLSQVLSVVGGRYYNISFYLENRGYQNNSFVLLVGA